MAALGALFRFGFGALLDRALARLPPAALERFFIASTRMLRIGIVAGEGSTGHGVPRLGAQAARSEEFLGAARGGFEQRGRVRRDAPFALKPSRQYSDFGPLLISVM